MQCKNYSYSTVQCTVYRRTALYFTVYNVQCTVYSVQHCTIQCTVLYRHEVLYYTQLRISIWHTLHFPFTDTWRLNRIWPQEQGLSHPWYFNFHNSVFSDEWFVPKTHCLIAQNNKSTWIVAFFLVINYLYIYIYIYIFFFAFLVAWIFHIFRYRVGEI